jgi:hypothetical protein
MKSATVAPAPKSSFVSTRRLNLGQFVSAIEVAKHFESRGQLGRAESDELLIEETEDISRWRRDIGMSVF